MNSERGGQSDEPTSYGLRPPQPPPSGPIPQQGHGAGPYEPTQAMGDGGGGRPGPPGAPNLPGSVPTVAASVPPQTPRVIGGRYELTSRLGHGGMGTVWLGRDLVVKREVAIKEPRLPEHLTAAERQTAYQRMEREAQAAARIDHPSVVTMHDVVVEEGRPWVVMELVRGQSLADRLKEGTLDPREAARIGAAVAGALQAAHEAGVLHRDVKPDNVLLGRSGRVVLTDFGIAQVEGEQRLTETGAFVGSPEFIAPERVLGQHPGPASDLWSLGVVLYAAVEGVSPFRRANTPATLQAVLSAEPQVPSRAVGQLGSVIMQLLRKDPMMRPTVGEVRDALEKVSRPTPDVTRMPYAGFSAGGSKWVPPVLQNNRRRQFGLVGGVVVVVLALLVLLLDPFGGGGLPDGWEKYPEHGTVKASLAVPSDYDRKADDDGTSVTFYDPSGVFRIYLDLVDNSDADPEVDNVIDPDGWAEYYRNGGENGNEVAQQKVRPTTTTYQGRDAYELTVDYVSGTDTSDDPYRYYFHQLVVPKDDKHPKDSKVYWRLQVRMPGEGWAHPVGEELYEDVVDHLEIEDL